MCMKNHNLIKDTAQITDIPIQCLDKFTELQEKEICHYILGAKNGHKKEVSIDIGIGNIELKLSEDEIMYKFSPSESLAELIKKSITKKESPIIEELSDRIITLFKNTYKDLM